MCCVTTAVNPFGIVNATVLLLLGRRQLLLLSQRQFTLLCRTQITPWVVDKLFLSSMLASLIVSLDVCCCFLMFLFWLPSNEWMFQAIRPSFIPVGTGQPSLLLVSWPRLVVVACWFILCHWLAGNSGRCGLLLRSERAVMLSGGWRGSFVALMWISAPGKEMCYHWVSPQYFCAA
jgi:hypothetical protein